MADPRDDARDAALNAAIASGIPFVIAGTTSPTETAFLRAAGLRSPATSTPATEGTVFALYSVTKLFTTTAALQCVEDGLLDLDAPARTYLPEIGDLEVLVRLEDDGTMITRPPAREITPRMLLLHTAGIGYDMFDARCALIARSRAQRPSATPLRDTLSTPLLHDPGERWTYGMSIDWLGLIVAAVRGRRLEEVFRERIYAPCGMTSTSFDVPEGMRARLATPHRRGRDGVIAPTAFSPPATAELDMGGQGLFSTVPDLLALLRVWLGDGSAPGGQVLRPETIDWATRGEPGLTVTPLQAAIPALTREVEFLPGIRTSWGYSFLVNEEDVPGGRRAGSGSWAGLGNTHYWIDRASGIAGVWATQLLPFYDPAAADGAAAFERAVYAERTPR